MKKLLLLTAVIFSMATAAHAGNGPQPYYKIQVKIKGLQDTLIYLAHYMGDNTYLADSARLDKKGVAVFSRDTVLECGIYMIALNRTKLFEFIVYENDFSLETDTVNYTVNMKVKNSKENTLFFEFQRKMYEIGVEEDELKKVAQSWLGDPSKRDTLTKLNEYIKQLPQKAYKYRADFVQQNPDAVITKIFNVTKEPEVPEPPKDINGNIDSNWQFYYYRNHYWDYVDFNSGCMVRTPVYHGKLMRYLEKLTVQHPDSIYAAAVTVIDKALAHPEMFRYTLIQIVNKYRNSPYICMDGIAVRLAYKYYTYDKVFWLDSTDIYRTRADAESFLPTLCHLPAPDLHMHDSTLERKIVKIVESDTNEESRGVKLGILLSKEKTTNLYDVKANYTVVVFWDPDCGHCKKEMPIIKGFYDTVKARGVEVYAVGVEPDLENWLKYVRDNKLKWINVIDVYNISQFRKYYNITSTPQIFLLDKDKKIIAKRLGAEQLKEILYHELGLPYTAPPKKEGEEDEHNEHDGHGH